MILVTTSRESSKNARILARKIADLVPESIYLTRGKKSLKQLIEIARADGYPKICIITNSQGNPSLMRFIKLNALDWNWAEELKIKGVYVNKGKQKATSIKCSEEIQKLFNVEPDEEASFEIQKQDKQIIFKKASKVLIKIKLKE